MNLDKAKNALREILGTFPFANDIAMGRMVGALFTMLDPANCADWTMRVPMWVINSDAPGLGKTLLASLAISIRHPHAVVTPPSTNMLDAIASAFLRSGDNSGDGYLFLDNVSRLDSDDLSALISSEFWEIRKFRTSELVQFENCLRIFATGNGVLTDSASYFRAKRRSQFVLMDCIARRSQLIQLRYENRCRKPVSVERLVDHSTMELVTESLIEALRAIADSWVEAGSNFGSVTMPGFEAWSLNFGGLVEHAGFPPLVAVEERVEQSPAPKKKKGAKK